MEISFENKGLAIDGEIKQSGYEKVTWEALQSWCPMNYSLSEVDSLRQERLSCLKAAEAAKDDLTCGFCCEQLGYYYQTRQSSTTCMLPYTIPLAEDFLSAVFFYQLALGFYQRKAVSEVVSQRIAAALATIEEYFLVKGLGLDEPLLDQPDIQNFQQRVQADKNELASIRQHTTAKVDKLPSHTSDDYISAVQVVYTNIAKAMTGLLTRCWQESLQRLAVVSEPPCDYAVILFGSAADGMLTPYSDMEWGILIKEESKEAVHFFQRMTQLMHLRILNLGETTPRIMNHPDAITPEWKLKSPLPNGLSFDGAGDGGCKNPLGKTKKTDQGTVEVFSLIQTPAQLASYQSADWMEKERLLPSSLVNVRYLVGDETLVTAYITAVSTCLQQAIKADSSTTLGNYFGRQLLIADLSRFKPRAGKEEIEGRTCSIKHDFYRLPNMIINQLALIAHIVPHPNDNLWQRIDRLQMKDYWSDVAAKNLKRVLAQAGALRLDCYSKLGEQAESAWVEKEGNAAVMGAAHRGSGYTLTEERLFSLYQTLVPLFDAVKNALKSQADLKKSLYEASLSGFTNKSDRTRGYIYQQLLRFEEAEACFVQALEEARQNSPRGSNSIINEPELAARLMDLGLVRQELGSKQQQGLANMQEALEILKKFYGNMNIEVGTANFRLGDCYQRLGQYDKAIGHLTEAKKIFNELCGKGHPNTARCEFILGQLETFEIAEKKQTCRATGLIHLQQGTELRLAGAYQQAIDTHQLVLSSYREFLGEDDADMARVYNELAMDYCCLNSLKEKEEAPHQEHVLAEAENYANKALKLFETLEQRHKVKHQRVIDTYAVLYKISIASNAKRGQSARQYLEKIASIGHSFNLSKQQICDRINRLDSVLAIELLSSLNLMSLFTIPEPSPAFKNLRESKLAHISEAILATDPLVIIGIHGVGKSQLAMKFAYQHRGEYQNCLWIAAHNKETLRSQFLELAIQLNLGEEQKKLLVVSVYKELAKSRKNLIIFDDAASHDEIIHYLPNEDVRSQFDIIITSVNATGWLHFQTLAMKPDTDDMKHDAIHYIRAVIKAAAEASPHQDEDIRELAQELGYLALALAQATHYIYQTKITIRDYLNLYKIEKSRLALLKRNVTRADRYQLSVHTVVRMTLDKVKESSTKAIDVMNACAYFSEKNILKQDLYNYFFAGDELKCNETMQLLVSHSLIDSMSNTRSFNIHRLIQEIIRLDLEIDESVLWDLFKQSCRFLLNIIRVQYPHPGLKQAVGIIKADFIYRRHDSNKIKYITAMLPHALAVIGHAERLTYQPQEIFDLLYTVGLYYLDYSYDIKLAKKYLTQAEKLTGLLNIRNYSLAKVHRQLFKAYLRNALTADTHKRKANYFDEAEKHLSNYLTYSKTQDIKQDMDRANFYLRKIEFFDNQTVDHSSSQKIPDKIKTREQLVEQTKKYLDAAKSKLSSVELELRDNYEGMLSHYYGTYYFIVGSYQEAIKHYEFSIEIKKELNDKRELGRSYEGRANCYNRWLRQSKSPYDRRNLANSAIDNYKLALAQKLIFHETLYHVEIVEVLYKLAELLEYCYKDSSLITKQFGVEAIVCRYYISFILRNMNRKNIDNERSLISLLHRTGRQDKVSVYISNIPYEDLKQELAAKNNFQQKQITSYFSPAKTSSIVDPIENVEISIEHIFKLLQLNKYTGQLVSVASEPYGESNDEVSIQSDSFKRKKTMSVPFDEVNREASNGQSETNLLKQHSHGVNQGSLVTIVASTTGSPLYSTPQKRQHGDGQEETRELPQQKRQKQKNGVKPFCESQALDDDQLDIQMAEEEALAACEEAPEEEDAAKTVQNI